MSRNSYAHFIDEVTKIRKSQILSSVLELVIDEPSVPNQL